MRYEFTSTAHGDFNRLINYGVQNWNLDVVQSYLGRLETVFHMLTEFPKSGRLYRPAKDGRANIYTFPHESHKIFYEIHEEYILVTAILGERELPRFD